MKFSRDSHALSVGDSGNQSAFARLHVPQHVAGRANGVVEPMGSGR
jgi:hypothetical protein